MISPLEGCLDVNNKAAEVTSRRFVVSKETSLIVRLVDRRAHRHPAGRLLVFRALAADVHVPLVRDLVVRLAVQGGSVCSVGLDFVVCP